MNTRSWPWQFFGGLLLIPAFDACAAQAASTLPSYPSKSIRIVVGMAPGGGTDIATRLFAQKLSESVGQTVLVENRAGAGGIVGAEIAAKATQDGHTLMMTSTTQTVLPSMYKSLPYDIVKDFAPISVVVVSPIVFTAHPSVPVASLRELISLAKAKPGEVTYGSAGNGSIFHLAMELFGSMAGARLMHVPFNGGGPSTNAALGGQIQLLSGSMPTALPNVRAGKLRGLGVTSAQRSQLAPDLPTVAESSGLSGYEAALWYGLIAPAATPMTVIRKLNAEVASLLKQRDVKEKLTTLGFELQHNSPEEFAQLIRSDIVKWGKVVRDSGAKID